MIAGHRFLQAPAPKRELAVGGLHLFALVGFAVSQPLFEVLSQDATFFVARGSEAVDVWVLALGVLVFLPLPMLALEALAGLVSGSLRRGLHIVFVAVLIALVLLPPTGRLGEGGSVLGVVLAGGALGALAYARFAPARTFLTVLSPAPLVFVALFLLDPSIAKLLRTEETTAPGHRVDSRTSVVMLVLDELPLAALLDDAREIDPVLFPNFARLASRSTWFRNATTNHNASEYAVPALLTGQFPSDPSLLPIAVDYPDNLFSLLSASHRMNVWETCTGLWPRREQQRFGERMGSLLDDVLVVYGHVVLPGDLAARLPAVDTNWGGFRGEASLPGVEGEEARGLRLQPLWESRYASRTDLVRGFIESIDASDEPALHFLHTIYPHRPFDRLPTGQRYTYMKDRCPGLVEDTWTSEYPWLPALGFQRHLLQLGHVDQLLGELLDRLEALDLFERSLVVLIADHGICFRSDEPVRGGMGTAGSARDLLHVPLLVKEPFQSEARRTDRNVQAIDVLPTMMGALEVELPWTVDGASAFDPTATERADKVMYLAMNEEPVVVSGAMPTSWPTLRDKRRLFGAAPGWGGVYAMGPHPELLGRSVKEMERAAPVKAQIGLVGPHRYHSVAAGAERLPAYIEGEFLALDAPVPEQVAVAINGVVRGVTSTYRWRGGTEFSVMVAPEALSSGRNRVEVFGLVDGVRLAPIIGYRLEGERIVALDGRTFELVPDALHTLVDVSAGKGYLALKGRAADLDAGRPAETLAVFLEGECIFAGPMNRRRETLEEQLTSSAGPAGFRYVLPVTLTADEVRQKLRIFALLSSVATEMDIERPARER